MENSQSIATVLTWLVFDSSEDEEEPQPPKRQRKFWTKNWILRRPQDGFYAKLLVQLRSEEPQLYRNFLRMNAEQFDHLLALVTPLIKKEDTIMRKSIRLISIRDLKPSFAYTYWNESFVYMIGMK